ncbi:MAG TPA: hypothetical protein VL021_05505 [Brumimicrobium sp.]|nr:hypothetical protein [Brumimicrobium sp.]
MKQFVFFSICFLTFIGSSFGQEDYFLTPQNKAYIYHTVRKSPVLERNIGRYIIYNGEEIKFPNGEINYDSTELMIINNPENLRIYTHDIRRAPKGILAELANKVAVWELNKTLQSYRNESLEKDGRVADFERFETILLGHLPEKAIRVKKDEPQILKKIERISNPTLTFKDKVAMLDGLGNWTEEEKQLILKAYNFAYNEWISLRTYEIFIQLGGEADYFVNILTAAGDGSSTSGLFEEREKDERGRWNKGLPKSVGLFPYESVIRIKPNSKKKKPEILPMEYTIHQFDTPENGNETNIHLDIWGYNSEKQTTAVITKAGKYYPLFGSAESRFLSPDSSAGGGLTYMTIIRRIEQDIADFEEKISGKRGYDYWIEHFENKKFGTKLTIDKIEHDLSSIRQSATTTKTKKAKIITDSKQSKRIGRQEKVVQYYGELKTIEKKIATLKEEKENAKFQQQLLIKRMNEMYDLIGRQWVKYKVKNGLYIYEDSARFDLYTQEFTFPAVEEPEVVEVKLLAIPTSHKNAQYDEVMMHINVTDVKPFYTSQVQLELNDLFAVDKYELPVEKLFSEKDSLAVLEFFEALYDKKMDFNIIVRGGGVGKWKNGSVFIDYKQEELSQYPGKNDDERHAAKESEEFKQLRTTEVSVHIDRNILMQVNSFTDPVKSNFIPDNKKILSVMQQYNLSSNQVLSAYRAYSTLTALKYELNLLASEYLSQEKAAKVIDRLNKEIDKAKITVGKTSIKYKGF